MEQRHNNQRERENASFDRKIRRIGAKTFSHEGKSGHVAPTASGMLRLGRWFLQDGSNTKALFLHAVHAWVSKRKTPPKKNLRCSEP